MRISITSNLSPLKMSSAERRVYIEISRVAWALILCIALISTLIIFLTDLGIEGDKISLNIVVGSVLLIVSFVYTYVRTDNFMLVVSDNLAIMCLFAPIGNINTYTMTYAGAKFNLWDEQFAAADLFLGFNWKGYLEWMNAHPFLAELLEKAYSSIYQQVIAIVLLLTVQGQYRRLQLFVLSGLIGAFITSLISGFVPALGSYWYFEITPEMHHPNISLTTMNTHLQHFLSMRGDIPIISIDNLMGIVTFPSFHTVLAILFIWGFWTVPLARWIALTVNVAMLAATPLWGSHHLMDMVSGAAVAVTAITLAWWLRLALERRAYETSDEITADALASARICSTSIKPS